MDLIAKEVYGKPISKCLGKPQTIQKNKLKGKVIEIQMLPEDVLNEKHVSLPCTTGKYIDNIVRHCQTSGINIKTINK